MEDNNNLSAEQQTPAAPVKKKKGGRIFLIVVLVLAVALGAGYGYYHSMVRKLQRPAPALVSSEIDEQSEDVLSDAAAMENATAGLEETEAIEAALEVLGDKDVFNILVIGSDERTHEFSPDGNADTCILMSIEKSTGNVRFVSLERFTGVQILSGQYAGEWDWLTHTLRYGGGELLMEEVQDAYKVEVTHYARTNIYTYIQLIDALGGVDITLDEDDVEYLNSNHHQIQQAALVGIEVKPEEEQVVEVGENTLNGVTAMTYVRMLNFKNDWARGDQQQAVLQAIAEKAKAMTLKDFDNLMDTILPLVETNLTEKEIASLLVLAPKYLVMDAKIERIALPAQGTYGVMTGKGGRKMYAVDFQTNAKILQELLYGKVAPAAK